MNANTQHLKFQFIDDAVASLPRNIGTVQASSLGTAISAMFNMAASDSFKNFIVWNPLQPLLTQEDFQLLETIRAGHPFKMEALCNLRPHAPEQNLGIRCKIKSLETEEEQQGSLVRASLRTLFSPRLRQLFETASAMQGQLPMRLRELDYEVSGGYSGLANVAKPNLSLFHIDQTNSFFFRLVHAAQGAGTYVAGNDDVKYINNDGFIRGELNNPEALIWMLRSGSYALMREGGAWKSSERPALHSTPFENQIYPVGQSRVFERCDFRFER